MKVEIKVIVELWSILVIIIVVVVVVVIIIVVVVKPIEIRVSIGV